MFFDPLPDELLAPRTEALERVRQHQLRIAPSRLRGEPVVAGGAGSLYVGVICIAAQASSQLGAVYRAASGKSNPDVIGEPSK